MSKHSRRLKHAQDKVQRLIQSKAGTGSYKVIQVEDGDDIEQIKAEAQKAHPLNLFIIHE